MSKKTFVMLLLVASLIVLGAGLASAQPGGPGYGWMHGPGWGMHYPSWGGTTSVTTPENETNTFQTVAPYGHRGWGWGRGYYGGMMGYGQGYGSGYCGR